MKKLLMILMLTLVLLPFGASAYYHGNRTWMTHNSPNHRHPDEGSNIHVYEWGHRYHARGRHSTVRVAEDKASWMHTGNLRTNNSPGIYHWKNLKTAE